LGLFQGKEDLAVEQLIPELPVETLIVAVFPGTARFDKERLDPDTRQPVANHPGRELGAVVRPDIFRRTMPYKEFGEAAQDIISLQTPLYHNSQTLPAILVNDRQDLYGPSILGPVHHEVIGPDMVSMGRPKTNTGTVVKPETPPFGLPLRDLEPFLPPDPLHPLVVDLKTLPL